MTISTVTETDLEENQTYHSFDPAIAKQVGVHAAVVFRNLAFWIGENRKHGRNFHDERHWTYNSLKAYGEQFDYLSEKQIRTALDKLVMAKLIIKGQHHRDRYKRENWYALGEAVRPSGNMEKPKRANDTYALKGSPTAPEGKCIKNKYKPDSKPYLLCDAEADLQAVWNAFPTDRRRNRKACLRLVSEARKEVALNDLVSAARAYAAESAANSRSRVSFFDNWLREGRWRRFLEDIRWQNEKSEAQARRQSAKVAMWIKAKHAMCQHLTDAQVIAAVEHGKLTKAEAMAAGFWQPSVQLNSMEV